MSGASFMLTLACPKVPWFCSLEFHELQGGKGPQYGYGTNREAAMKAFNGTCRVFLCPRSRLACRCPKLAPEGCSLPLRGLHQIEPEHKVLRLYLMVALETR